MADARGLSGARTRSGFFAMPSSVPGRVTALSFVVVVGIAVMALVAEPGGVAWRGTLALLLNELPQYLRNLP